MQLKSLSIAVLAFMTAACSGPAVKDSLSIQQSAVEQAKSVAADQDPSDIINTTRDLQIEAQREDLYFFSPSYMEQAESSMESAESALKSKKPNHEIIAHALTAQKYFKRGLEIKTTAQTQLKAGFDGLAMLKEIKTDSLLKSDYDDLLDDMKDLIVLIEQGKTTEALTDQKGFLTEITDLEIKTLKKSYFEPAELAFEKAEDEDAEDFAPKSLERAQKALDGLEKLIETQPKQRDQIKNDSVLTTRLSQHALNVSKAVQPLLKLKADTAENHVLFIESLLQRIGTALNQEDVTHLTLDSQSIAIAQSAETIYRQAQAVGQKEQWEQEKQNLLQQISQLKVKTETPEIKSEEPLVETTDSSENQSEQPEAKEEVVTETKQNESAEPEAAQTEAEQSKQNSENDLPTEAEEIAINDELQQSSESVEKENTTDAATDTETVQVNNEGPESTPESVDESQVTSGETVTEPSNP